MSDTQEEIKQEANEPDQEFRLTIASRYEILATLGQGGMGAVYKAHDTRLERVVAIKTILPEKLRGKEASRRFLREAVALARLNHPNILTLFDSGQDGHLRFIVMELGGQDLGHILETGGGPLSLERARHVAGAVCRALQYAHSHGIVHRDIKPGNILLGSAEEPGWGQDTLSTQVKVMDFGLAKIQGTSAITGVSQQLGTPQYMSPEQVLGREADEKSDLYSFGVLFYELCTGVRPFDSADVQSILSQHLSMSPVPPSAFNANIPQALEVLIMRLLEKDPYRRPASATEVLNALDGMSTTVAAVTAAGGSGVLASPLGILPARTPLVGRDKELEFLKAQYEAMAASGGGRLILVRGEPGAGKTRLVRELGVFTRVRGGVYVEGRYLKEGTVPYGPWVEAIREAIRGLDKVDLVKALGPYGAELSQIFPELVELAGPFPPPPMLGPQDMRLRLFDGLAGLIKNLSDQKPLVMLIDDCQWASGLTVFVHIAMHLGDSKALMIGAYRAQEFEESNALMQDWAEMNRNRLFSQMNLNLLTEKETSQIISHHFGDQVAGQLGDVIHRRTKGNPFFVEEILKSLAESENVHWREAGWQMDDLSNISIPRSLKVAIDERVSRLGDEGKDILTQAAVLGQEFSFAVLQAMAGASEDDLLERLDKALAARLLVDRSSSREELFGFADDQIQQVLYEGLSALRRRRLHLKAGQAIESVYGDRLDPHAEELARHFVEGRVREKGAAYSFQAGLKSDRLFEWHRSIPYYRTALDLWEELGGHLEERARIYESLGDACFKSMSDYEMITDYYEKARILYEAMGNRRKVATIHSQLGRRYQYVDIDMEKALSHLHKARAILEELPKGMALGLVYAAMVASYSFYGRLDESVSWIRKSVEVGERLNHPAVLANGLAGGMFLSLGGEIDEGIEMLERSWQIATQNNLAFISDLIRLRGAYGMAGLKDPISGLAWLERKPDYRTINATQAVVPGYALLEAYRGNLVKARGIYEGWRTRLEEKGQPAFGNQPKWIALLLLLSGDWTGAGAFIGDAIRWSTKANGDSFTNSLFWVLGKLYFEQGELQKAEENFLKATNWMETNRCNLELISCYHSLCELYLASGKLQEAQHYHGKAQQILNPNEDYRGLMGDMQLAEGMVKAAEGRWEEADAAFGRAIGTYQEYSLKWDEAKACYEWGCSLVEKEKDRSHELLGKAIALWEQMGASPYAEKCRMKLATIV